MGGVQQCVNGLIFRNSIEKRKRTKQAGDSSTHLKTYAKRDDSGLLLNLSIFGFRYYLANTFFCYLFYIFLKYKDKHLHKTAQWPCDIPELMVQRIPRTKNTIYKPYSID